MNDAQKSVLKGVGALGGCFVMIALFAAAIVLWQQGTWLPAGLWLGGLTLLAALFYWGLLPFFCKQFFCGLLFISMLCFGIGLSAAAIFVLQQGTWLSGGAWAGGLALLASLFWYWDEWERLDWRIPGIPDKPFRGFLSQIILGLVFVLTVFATAKTVERVHWSEAEVISVKSIGEHYENWRVMSATDKGAGIYVLTLENPESSSPKKRRSWRVDETAYMTLNAYAGSDTAVSVILKRVE